MTASSFPRDFHHVATIGATARQRRGPPGSHRGGQADPRLVRRLCRPARWELGWTGSATCSRWSTSPRVPRTSWWVAIWTPSPVAGGSTVLTACSPRLHAAERLQDRLRGDG